MIKKEAKENPKYEKKPYISEVSPILNNQNEPFDQRVAKCLFLLEKMIHESNDSTQIAIFELNDVFKAINAESHTSL